MLFNHLYFDMYTYQIPQSNKLIMDKMKTHPEIYHIMEATFVSWISCIGAQHNIDSDGTKVQSTDQNKYHQKTQNIAKFSLLHCIKRFRKKTENLLAENYQVILLNLRTFPSTLKLKIL